jgi:C-terminal processing protease CtpA/Prc
MMKQHKPGKTFISLVLLMFSFLYIIIGCSSTPVVPRAIKNIEVFARLYGYVKYFHPSDEANEIDWERFAIYGVKQVEPAKNSTELKKILEELFLPISPAIVIYHSKDNIPFSVSKITPADTTGMKLIAWQHYGVRLNKTDRVYESIRLHRKVKYAAGDYGYTVQEMDAVPFRGKDFIYKAAVKVDRGNGHLAFRVYRSNRENAFFDFMDDRPIQAHTWKTYEIKGTIADDAASIAFGCYLPGSGRILVDDFQLVIKENDQWKPVEIKNAGFEENKEGEKPQGWTTRGASYTIEVTTQTPEKGNKCLIMEPLLVDGPGRLYRKNPGFGEYIDKKLGMGLSCIVPLALYSTNGRTYPPAAEQNFKNLVNALETEVPQEYTANNGYIRWANVVMTWNVFQHFYPYFDLINVDWKSQLTRALQKAQLDKNETDFLWTLRKMVAALKDGHNRVSHPLEKDYAGFPFKVDWIENHVVITAAKNNQFQKGDIIVSIDGVAAGEVLKNAETFISGSPQWKRKQALERFGLGPTNTTAQLIIQRDDKTIDITVTRNFQGKLEEFKRKPFLKLNDNIFYVDLVKLSYQEALKVIDKLAGANGVILDIRGGGTYTLREVFFHLVDTDMKDFILSVPEVIYPDRENVEYTGYDYTYPCRPPLIKGKKVFITDNRANNLSESFLGIAEHLKLGEIVGQPTAGIDGQFNSFFLPGRYRVYWAGLRVMKQDRTQFFLKGIEPTVLVQRTIKGVKQGKDELLEEAIRIINSE